MTLNKRNWALNKAGNGWAVEGHGSERYSPRFLPLKLGRCQNIQGRFLSLAISFTRDEENSSPSLETKILPHHYFQIVLVTGTARRSIIRYYVQILLVFFI